MTEDERGVGTRLAAVRERIAAAARGAGRDPGEVLLVGVSKGVGLDLIADALAAGLTDLGENRAQELVAKAAELGSAARSDEPVDQADQAAPARPAWHFVGRLQRNKVRLLAPHVALWHSVDRPELGEPIARYAPHARLLVEVNLGAEPQKGGCDPAGAAALVDELRGRGLLVEGLMTVPPVGEEPRPHFAALRELTARLGLAHLSMGMTADFETAIAEGATMVRVGTAVFGPRRAGPDLRR